jgi:protein-S-isoprenylcysteine O-methyltransferase Ste14
VPDDLFLRCAIVTVSAVVYWVGVWFEAQRVRRQIGRSPNLTPNGTKEHLLWAGWVAVVAIWMGQPWLVWGAGQAVAWRLAPGLLSPAGFAVGLGLVLAGYAGTLWCYVAMGKAWRIGVNRQEKAELVSVGPYRVVRHPIYGFQIVMLVGAVLLLPTLLSVFALLLHFTCVRVKAADEESYLLGQHPQRYREYQRRTGGLLPRLGKPPSHA